MRANLVTDRVVSFMLCGLIIALPFLTLLLASQPSRKTFKLGNNTGTRRGDFLGRLSTMRLFFCRFGEGRIDVGINPHGANFRPR
jgi:hypothetical protein